MLVTLGRGMAPAQTYQADKTMSGLLPACVFDIDATQESSYPGTGQLLMNNMPSPADGSEQSAYDFYLGTNSAATSTDPSFVGAAGDPDACFSFNGGNVLTLASGNNTPYLNNLSKTSGGSLPVTMALAFRATDETTSRSYMGGYVFSQPGVRLICLSTEQIRLAQGDGITTADTDGPILTPGNDYLVIFSLDAGGNWSSWINGAKNSGSIILVSNTTDSGPFRLMHNAGNGARLYAASLFNIAFTDAQATTLRGLYQTRHQRSYGA
jgi:hypothetical protein